MSENRIILKFTIGGLIFGIFFPAIAYITGVITHDLPISFNSLRALHNNNHLFFIIDTAPLIIATVAFIVGKRVQIMDNKAHIEIEGHINKLNSLNKELSKLSIIAENTENAIAIYNKNYDIEWINNGFVNLYGYTFDEYINDSSKNNIFGFCKCRIINEKITNAINNKQPVSYSIQRERKDGKKIWVQTTLTPYINNENQIEKLICINSDITELKNNEVKINEQNTLINQSIEYAKKIQNAVLPSIFELKVNVNDVFILYKPKNIVSGDFYWFYSIGGKTIIVSADCTGHGVPGGFMSMIGNTILNNFIKEKDIFDPDIILDYLNNEINTIVNKNAEFGQTDGMDVSVAFIDRDNNVLEMASANQIIFYIQNNELKEFYGDIWSIGGTLKDENENNFTSQQFKLEEVSHIYFSTDGYYDQFGGKEDKKLMKDVFIDLIIKNYKLPMENQKVIFDEYLNNWMRNSKQTDDIQVVGVSL